jgi:chromosomal replication initiation ATPase DnaA
MSQGEDLGRQLHLDFPRIDPSARPLIDSGPYLAPVQALLRWRSWPEGQMALVGDSGSGRSRLVRMWACEAGAALMSGAELAATDIEEISRLSIAALAIDDADLCEEPIRLLTALNLCRSRGVSVLMAGRREPAAWFSAPGDLLSRLRATPTAVIDPPDEATLLLRLQEECLRLHLSVPSTSLNYLVERMDRSWDAVARVAEQIVQTPGRGFSLHSARNVLRALGREAG